MEELEIEFTTEQVQRDVIETLNGGIAPNRFVISIIRFSVRKTIEKLSSSTRTADSS